MAGLERTVFYDLHKELGAKIVPFAGYEMPVQYKLGVMKEHLHCRAAAGLFDVSHMGQVILRPKSGDMADAALALETLVPVSVLGLKEGRQRYAMFTNATGGILDDLMVANRGDHLFLVVNAACKDADIAHMRAHLSDACEIEVIEDRALIALQGPKAEEALSRLNPYAAGMRFMDSANLEFFGEECWVSRSGYTGEDGYEISVPNAKALELSRALLDMDEIEPIGLGARDSLRLEAGLCLYGHDIDETTSPVEAALEWAIQKVRRRGGAREGGFPGAVRILDELKTAPHAAGWAYCRKAARPCATARPFSPRRKRARVSARSRRAHMARRLNGPWRWDMSRPLTPATGPRFSVRCAASACRPRSRRCRLGPQTTNVDNRREK